MSITSIKNHEQYLQRIEEYEQLSYDQMTEDLSDNDIQKLKDLLFEIEEWEAENIPDKYEN